MLLSTGIPLNMPSSPLPHPIYYARPPHSASIPQLTEPATEMSSIWQPPEDSFSVPCSGSQPPPTGCPSLLETLPFLDLTLQNYASLFRSLPHLSSKLLRLAGTGPTCSSLPSSSCFFLFPSAFPFLLPPSPFLPALLPFLFTLFLHYLIHIHGLKFCLYSKDYQIYISGF